MNLSLQKTANKTGVEIWTIRHWRYRFEKKLKLSQSATSLCEKFFKVGGCVRISEDDLNAWLAAQRLNGKSTSDSIEQFAEKIKSLQAEAEVLGLQDAARTLGLVRKLYLEI